MDNWEEIRLEVTHCQKRDISKVWFCTARSKSSCTARKPAAANYRAPG
jgi:histidinol phosphatase-like enzyme